jgi:hypothetical protein
MMSQVGFLDIGRVLAHVLGQPNREGKVKCFSTTISFFVRFRLPNRTEK